MLIQLINTLVDQQLVHEKNTEKQQEAIDLWHKAKEYPRKKKKAVRKKAEEDYNFWTMIDKWHKETLPFI